MRQWWTGSSHTQLLQAEHRLLTALVKSPFRKPSSSNDVDSRDTSYDYTSTNINFVEFVAPSHSAGLPTVVLAHGFGSGLGFFYRNIDDLLNSGKIGRVIGLDWLGMGGSARVACWQSPIRSVLSSSSKISFCNSKFTTSDAVDFFLDPLDQLLHDVNVFQPGEDVWLVGHSLGGYLAARYAIRSTHFQNESDAATKGPNLSKLILASPVGFQPPPSVHERIPNSSLPPAFRILDALWSSNFTPQALIRAMGSSRGRNAIKRALHGRIPHLNESVMRDRVDSMSELDLLANYLYHVTVAPASGEYAMNSLLEPAASEAGAGVYAREPLGRGIMTSGLLEKMKTQQSLSLKSVKVIFGDHDWMRFNENSARKECESIRSNCKIAAGVHIIPNAGHHLYLDNADSFVNHILDDG
ncbi:hypothetical protein ACHAWX_000943 [Stephanocyclus meneghinianus]